MEECLLRTSSENWCIINDGTEKPNIVMGISGYDYVFGSNALRSVEYAQCNYKNRWIHHTSFLWDYETRNMSYLKHPKRTPEYRLARDHLDFICPMKDYISRSDFINKTIDAARSQFYVESTEFEAIKPPSKLKFTPTSKLLTTQELETAAIYQTQPIEASL
ncbi:hypothetical protein Tco_1027307 [Tanacetum coccineum]